MDQLDVVIHIDTGVPADLEDLIDVKGCTDGVGRDHLMTLTNPALVALRGQTVPGANPLSE